MHVGPLILVIPAALTAGLVSLTAAGESWRVEELGIPVNAVTYDNSGAALAPAPGGEGVMFYTSYYRNTGAELVGCDWRSGQTFRKKLPSQGGYAVAVGLDGCVYVGGVSPGDLYRYDPKADTLATIDVKSFGVQYIWEAATAPDGTVYGAAGYPQSRLVAYTPATGEVGDLGEMAPGQKYLRSVCVDTHGKVWCGIGTRAHLVVYDPLSGTKRSVLPERYAGNSTVYQLEAWGDYVVASIHYDGVLLVYDAGTCEVIREIPKVAGEICWSLAQGGHDHVAYARPWPGGDVYRCDLRNGALTRIAPAHGLIKMVEEDRWIHSMDDQDYVVYDLDSERVVARTRLTEGGDGMNVFALTAGADGNVYGSTYINMHLFRCDAATGALSDLGKCSRWAGQVDSLSLGADGRIYIGAYVQAVLSVYDPRDPWRPGREPDSNPREIGPVGHGQYRTKANCLGPEGRIYVGSIPSYNSGPTGAFTICDPDTGAMDVRTDFVEGATVHALAADDAFVYGAGAKEFFVYDPAQDTKRFSDQRPVTALAAVKGGKVVGSAAGRVFVYDREDNAIIAEAENPAGDFTHMATDTRGVAYGVNANAVARINADGPSVTILAREGGGFAAVDGQGRVYFARGAKLFRYVPESE